MITGAVIGAVAVLIVAAYEYLEHDDNDVDSMGPNPLVIGLPVVVGGVLGAVVYFVQRWE